MALPEHGIASEHVSGTMLAATRWRETVQLAQPTAWDIKHVETFHTSSLPGQRPGLLNAWATGMRHLFATWLHNLVGLDDSPHKIALGLALGIFVGFLPIMGIQMIVVLPFAVLFCGNKTAAIAGVWITNPVTFIPIYYLNYSVGLLLTPYEGLHRSDFIALFQDVTMSQLLKLGKEILVPLLAGGCALAITTSIPTYLLTRLLVARRRKRALALITSSAERVVPLTPTAQANWRSADPPRTDRPSPDA